jgi:cobalamin synthase
MSTENRDEHQLRSAGQRKINLIWESTQATIAIAVTLSTVAASVYLSLQSDKTAYTFLTNILFVVIGFYFGRTNHNRTGGIGGGIAGNRSA